MAFGVLAPLRRPRALLECPVGDSEHPQPPSRELLGRVLYGATVIRSQRSVAPVDRAHGGAARHELFGRALRVDPQTPFARVDGAHPLEHELKQRNLGGVADRTARRT